MFACCESLQETLIVGLTMLLGLRAGEAVHLTWGSYLSDLEVPELDVQHSEPDEDDPVGWDPKTGERVVAVIWPEVRDMLNDWWVATPYGRDAEDRILVNPRDAKPYKTLPEKLRTRIKSKVEGWSYQAGRRIAATLAVVHSERLTGREWNSRDHEAQFGHSHIVAQSYYQDVQRTHRIRRYEEEALKPSSATVQHSGEHHAGLSIILAQRTLNHLLAVDRRSRSKLAEAISVSETAIRKFSHGAPKSIPGWYWAAIDALVP